MRHAKLISALVLCICVVALIAFLHFGQNAEKVFAAAIRADTSFPGQIDAYRTLMRGVGAAHAQDILLKSFPDNSRTHMLDHETGKFLFDTQGYAGIGECKIYFAGGCFHGFISEVIAQRGLGDINAIVAGCKAALSQDQVEQCAHGVGHGLLEDIAGYEHLPEALSLCQSIFEGNHKSTVNCYDGVFMENNFGAFSVPPPGRWYKADDPMYPCNEPDVLDKPGAHEYCWGMQSQLTLHAEAYPFLGGDVAKVGAYCDSFSGNDRALCFEGLARQLQLTYSGDTQKIHSQCAKLDADESIMCDAHAAEAAYIYGDRSATTTSTCIDVIEPLKSSCYEALYQGFAIAFSATSTRLTACDRDVPEEAFKVRCAQWMQSDAAQGF
jgi:hypothetical protein